MTALQNSGKSGHTRARSTAQGPYAEVPQNQEATVPEFPVEWLGVHPFLGEMLADEGPAAQRNLAQVEAVVSGRIEKSFHSLYYTHTIGMIVRMAINLPMALHIVTRRHTCDGSTSWNAAFMDSRSPEFPLFIATANGLIYLMGRFNPPFCRPSFLDPSAIQAGEWWRLVTFLFVPPMEIDTISSCSGSYSFIRSCRRWKMPGRIPFFLFLLRGCGGDGLGRPVRPAWSHWKRDF